MELPTELAGNLLLLAAIVLLIVPFFSAYGTYHIAQVFMHDDMRPRNRLIRRFFVSGVFVTLVAFFTMALAIGVVVRAINGEMRPSDFGGVTFAFLLAAVFLQPYFNWRALRALNGQIEVVKGIPESNTPDSADMKQQHASEDLYMGDKRRGIEAEHVAKQRKLDKGK